MSIDDDDRFLGELKTGIKKRTAEQMERHQRVDPNVSREQVLDIQLDQEREKLLGLAEKFEEDGQDRLAEFCRILADEWLSELRVELLRL